MLKICEHNTHNDSGDLYHRVSLASPLRYLRRKMSLDTFDQASYIRQLTDFLDFHIQRDIAFSCGPLFRPTSRAIKAERMIRARRVFFHFLPVENRIQTCPLYRLYSQSEPCKARQVLRSATTHPLVEYDCKQ